MLSRLAVLTFTAALLLSYGGVRAPDTEVVFRAAEGLADGGRMEVRSRLRWADFGVATGVNGHTWSVFGPLQSLVFAGGIATVDALGLADGSWPSDAALPPSHYIEGGRTDFRQNRPPALAPDHRRRTLLSWVNPLLHALTTVVLALMLLRLGHSRRTARLVGAWYGVGGLGLAYAGTMLSEPLATSLVAGSMLALASTKEAGGRAGFWGGLLLGLATTAHITAILFAPFFLVWAWRGGRRSAAAFCVGMAGPLLALAAWNSFRFGSVFQTGRTVHAELGLSMGYGAFVTPWKGLAGLLISPGKGLLLYCPFVLVAILGLRQFGRTHRGLAGLVAACFLFRLLFIASRSDWHGGFCLGPRYLVMALPLLVLPLAAVVEHRRGRWLALAFGLCVGQQVVFGLSEPFTFFHAVAAHAKSSGIDPFMNDWMYWTVSRAPVLHLAEGFVGPGWLHDVAIAPSMRLAIGAGVGCAAAIAWARANR
jgi:hypothetical protein